MKTRVVVHRTATLFLFSEDRLIFAIGSLVIFLKIQDNKRCCNNKIKNDEQKHKIKAIAGENVFRLKTGSKDRNDHTDRKNREEHMKKITGNGRDLLVLQYQIRRSDRKGDTIAHESRGEIDVHSLGNSINNSAVDDE